MMAASLQTAAATKYDSTLPEHEALLMRVRCLQSFPYTLCVKISLPLYAVSVCLSVRCPTQLWHALRGGERLEARVSKRWQLLGFQGDDPATDFRGMGTPRAAAVDVVVASVRFCYRHCDCRLCACCVLLRLQAVPCMY